eukprot:CAMPEP_0167764904 /NCGR_PEP_ID=MMETSP0110_2-20121227/14341_1 /TAXON_ID=629695 /ORGANISM="Gymnochlora sp., Strain CCMP2014" /LENGTH=679 /DNA_ID=CAMNT_0007652459 /DNA_START=328 /DNA_END=2370 /DNA_ORIENTATION=-
MSLMERKDIDSAPTEGEKVLFQVHVKKSVGIDFDKYENIPVEVSGRDGKKYGVMESFSSFKGLPAYLVRNLNLCRFSKPTPVQKYAVPVAINSRDVMCCAQTGSGKTAAFLLPCFANSLDSEKPLLTEKGQVIPQALVLAPTRELACQIHSESLKFANNSGFQSVCIYGGASFRTQLQELAMGADVVVATPGRLIDLLTSQLMSLTNCMYLCLDEADRMLDMGFEPQIRAVVQESDMPESTKGRQTLMFSATFPEDMQKLAGDFMGDYVWIGVGRVGATTDSITQKMIEVTHNAKIGPLLELLDSVPGPTLIFVAKKRTAAWLSKYLSQRQYRCLCIHGDLSQVDRTRSLQQFRKNKCRLLVATDVAARGLDISDVTHVINYDLPSNIDDYVHRIGRTGRAGRRGLATSLVVPGNSRDGNDNVAKQLVKVLKDAKQDVPKFLEKMAERKDSKSRNKASSAGRSNFGGVDYRNQNQWTKKNGSNAHAVSGGSNSETNGYSAGQRGYQRRGRYDKNLNNMMGKMHKLGFDDRRQQHRPRAYPRGHQGGRYNVSTPPPMQQAHNQMGMYYAPQQWMQGMQQSTTWSPDGRVVIPAQMMQSAVHISPHPSQMMPMATHMPTDPHLYYYMLPGQHQMMQPAAPVIMPGTVEQSPYVPPKQEQEVKPTVVEKKPPAAPKEEKEKN